MTDSLPLIWYVLVGILFFLTLLLDGITVGLGLLFPWQDEKKREKIEAFIAPIWDINGLWLVIFAGALLASFPKFFASLLSSHYLAFFLLLFSIMLKVAAIEFRSKRKSSLFFLSGLLYCTGWGLICGSFLLIPLFVLFFLFHGSAAIGAFGYLHVFKRSKSYLALSALFLACTLFFELFRSYSHETLSYAAHGSLMTLSVIALIGLPLFIFYTGIVYRMVATRNKR
jgi:cytochrome bd-type quinol oxidase subunit 2